MRCQTIEASTKQLSGHRAGNAMAFEQKQVGQSTVDPRLPEPRLSEPSIIRIEFQANIHYAHTMLIRFVLIRLLFARSKRLAIWEIKLYV